MDQTFRQDSIPVSESVDKSSVLEIRPLRLLVPVFSPPPNASGAHFFCVNPYGPFPSEVTPFYPFFGYVGSQKHPEQNPQTPVGVPNQTAGSGYSNPITAAVQIAPYRTAPPTAQVNGDTSGTRSSGRSESQGGFAEEDEYSDSQNHGAELLSSFNMHISGLEDTGKSKRPKNKSQKKTSDSQETNVNLSDADVDSIVNNILSSFNLMEFNMVRQADGDRKSVGYILLIYDLLRRKLSQFEDTKEATAGTIRRPDLKASTVLTNKGIRTNIKKRVGVVPGVEVGDIFYFRMEMNLVGLHFPCMAGIDYMGLKINREEEPVAVSIVSSGGYEDNVEDGDGYVLIYSGQGGNIFRKDKEIMDQKLERGNLALEKSFHRGNEIRVIRGIKDLATLNGKVYVYDGLYKIQESWVEKGKSGCNVFKYKLVRSPGQPEAFMTWKSVQQWKDGITSRTGVILPDLTSGVENIPVSLVNDVDNEKGPAHFKYVPSLKYSKHVNLVESSAGCTCRSGCLPGNPNCPCIKKNGGYLPCIAHGVLVNPKSLTHECGFSCLCPPNCRNRVTQGGLKVHLEVFRTKDKGWGLRSWDPIRAGAFICEYAGQVIDISKIENGDEIEDDYIFDATRTYQPEDYLPCIFNEAAKIPFPLIITAKDVGNVARFMNHSCCPNVFWHPVFRENKEGYDVHIAFYAIKHIPPMTELTYNYGSVLPDKAVRKKNCQCGSSKCRGFLY
ncbi:histone-lysine N-methyltransferase, H3 lysine-9 specific SUVH1-like [Pistacia vera]|uniref:histone-lysine N-methyltransferase, H3 lysine-9 specific SUVH1-like n=1 Tax=Pistacia vera TaxID=55513 RepID=UPI0012632EC8|nr:histone-lysine N-methyltransferase, H3 lysine-9 specific SUVH1-like [Pistacia vera]XP_031280468.1 histone-lysine N-methyltransferase, H3 lysine-9 specific SUVH1-like [Pistacia vera]XP_031280469.1 histone-lysine N-methyltransferase, H3 lysine-9 specific SUVH1-like [Pistacia vera]XP_031280470.1 histone-lysine N-methyltransferase, H3 lysine-9 specific SUVH1-like [Pistacia vera]XP_031280472.1 histone-lysine N-methyltransferase, H3 lysine-9 specific SUVH1-like [Pistacia vera]